MIAIIAFIIVMFGSLNWLAIGFFQYDIVAGLFGYQGSIFSRIVYIIVGIAAIYLTYSIIKHKGKISVKRLAKEEPIKINNNKDNKIEEQEYNAEIIDNNNHGENKINNQSQQNLENNNYQTSNNQNENNYSKNRS